MIEIMWSKKKSRPRRSFTAESPPAPATTAVTTAERDELPALRRENRRLREGLGGILRGLDDGVVRVISTVV